MKNLIFLGPPGAGKGTQAMILAEKLGVPHISTGDILRQAISDETPLGIEAKSYMDQGDLVPDNLILDLIKDRLSQADTQKGWILDGFPRNVGQADFLATLLSQLNQDCDHVLNLDVPDDVLVQRLLARGRKDDNETTIRRRLEVYRQQTAPLIDYYQKHSLLRPVNGNLPMEEVTKSLETIV